MLESLMGAEEMRPEEGPILFVRSVAIAGDPRPVLPEPSIGLLITKEIMVIWLRIGTMGGEIIGRRESHVRSTKTGARGVGMQGQVQTRERGIVDRRDVNGRVRGLLCKRR